MNKDCGRHTIYEGETAYKNDLSDILVGHDRKSLLLMDLLTLTRSGEAASA